MSRVALLLRALEYKPTEACSSPLGEPKLGLERGGGCRVFHYTWGPENRGLLGQSMDQLT